MTYITLAFAFIVALLNVGCMREMPDYHMGADMTDQAQNSLVGENALSPNALSPNALSPNALSPNALSPNALSPNALSPNAMTAIQSPTPEGELSRMLLKYTVSCALPANAIPFTFSWTDSNQVVHNESYLGLLGIAPTWTTQPLDDTGQKMISACLLARTNYIGVHVTISVRSLKAPLKTLVGSEELNDYPHVEGGFWGNLFATTPYARACYDDSGTNVANSQSWQRYCATGYPTPGGVLECGMIHIIGPCTSYCKSLNGAGQYYPDCTDPVYGKTSEMITTALP